MPIITIHDAKTNLSRLIERAERGEDIVIARGKVPVARLTPIAQNPGKRPLGLLKGKFPLSPGFFDPLPQSELDAWEK